MFKKKATTEELGELRAIDKLVRQERFKHNLVSRNTIMVYQSTPWLKTQEDLLKLLEGAREGLMGRLAQRLEIPEGTPLSVDLKTGEVWTRS